MSVVKARPNSLPRWYSLPARILRLALMFKSLIVFNAIRKA